MNNRTFYKTNALHWKLKVIFFLICQIKIYWMIVSNSFFFLCQSYTSSGGGIWESVQLCWVGMGGRLDNITDSLTLDNSGKRVWRVSCFLQVKDNVRIFRKTLADTNVYLHRLTNDSILVEWLYKVVTPDGPTLPLIYIIVCVVDLVLVLNIHVSCT